MRVLRLFPLALLLGCVSIPVPGAIEQVPARCPDFSGTYQYPGMLGLVDICDKPWPEMSGAVHMPLPGEGGFYWSGRKPHEFAVEQDECRELKLIAFTVDPMSIEGTEDIPDHPIRVTLSLEPDGLRRQIVWSEDSLFFKRKFTPAGGRILPGPTFNHMEITFTKNADGSLGYDLLHRATANGKIVSEIHCTWPRAEP